MLTDYDAIAERYRQAKRQPWRTFLETETLVRLLGSLEGKAALDLACGEGHYTRMLRRRGAERVVGVDRSEGMIALAREQETRDPLGIDYLVQDGRDLALGEAFDLTLAAYLLNYARNAEELAAMCQGIARSLRPGGRFLAVNTNTAIDFAAVPSYRQYGFEARLMGARCEGAPITWTFHLDDGSFDVENYHLDAATYDQAFREAGLVDVSWHRPVLSPGGEAAHDPGFWDGFLAHPPVIFVECKKPGAAGGAGAEPANADR